MPTNGDSANYFLNLKLVREAAQAANLPFLNIVQAATWTPSMRVPRPDEMRFLIYTTLAHGALAGGDHAIRWTRRDDTGTRVPPGVYLARLEAGAVVRTLHIVLVD